MKLADWLQPDDIAIGYVAVYYGIPAYGHERCYLAMVASQQHGIRHVSRADLGSAIATKCCIECGKLLVPAEEQK